MSLLEVKHLRTFFKTKRGVVKAVNDVTYSLEPGETLGIVGESGSGKSVSAMSILKLLDGNGYVEGGTITFNGKDVVNCSQKEMYAIRGNEISVIFQEPMTSLNPVFTIEKQQYPFQISGGMRQRVMIAMALACKPKLLIADEPTTALDVTIQAQILKLMNDLKEKMGTAILFITHDLGVINEMADKVAVMYCGQVVEMADAKTIFTDGVYSHPYTEGLMISIPRLDTPKGVRLDPIDGAVPNPLYLPKGCKFAPRCKYCTKKCMEEEPELLEVEPNHQVRCFYAEKAVRKETPLQNGGQHAD